MTEEQINAVAVMRRAGNSNGEIAQTLGMTYDQVMQLSSAERHMIADMVKDHMETTSKTKLPYF